MTLKHLNTKAVPSRLIRHLRCRLAVPDLRNQCSHAVMPLYEEMTRYRQISFILFCSTSSYNDVEVCRRSSEKLGEVDWKTRHTSDVFLVGTSFALPRGEIYLPFLHPILPSSDTSNLPGICNMNSLFGY